MLVLWDPQDDYDHINSINFKEQDDCQITSRKVLTHFLIIWVQYFVNKIHGPNTSRVNISKSTHTMNKLTI